MAIPSEAQFLEFLKNADIESGMTVREDPPGTPESSTEAVVFSDAAQESNKDGKEGVPDRVLSQKSKSDVAERALIGAVLSTRDFETSSIQLKPVEKVSFQRTPTLLEDTVSKLGRK